MFHPSSGMKPWQRRSRAILYPVQSSPSQSTATAAAAARCSLHDLRIIQHGQPRCGPKSHLETSQIVAISFPFLSRQQYRQGRPVIGLARWHLFQSFHRYCFIFLPTVLICASPYPRLIHVWITLDLYMVTSTQTVTTSTIMTVSTDHTSSS